MKNTLAILSVVSMLSAGIATSDAHHSAALYDHDKTVVVEGTVKQWYFGNPHATLSLVVTTPNGEPSEWLFEGPGASALNRYGFARNTFQVGDKLRVSCHPMRDGRLGGFFIEATKADGTVFTSRAPS